MALMLYNSIPSVALPILPIRTPLSSGTSQKPYCLRTCIFSNKNYLLSVKGERKTEIPHCASARNFPESCGVPQIYLAEFSDTVLKSEVPVLVEFKAKWCPTSQLLNPTMEWASGKYKKKLKVVSVDRSSCPDLFEDYEVYKVPTLILFNKGKEITREGYMTKSKLRNYLDSALKSIVVA
ncbi:hypothetical protein IFM89_029353 [Coptis chinensis]|uniref:Thioredoxin domain-containing protein n=1 Tax=Coptis chinensis TaxID=261450 RepID=A0A835IR65_9MAGN|nr:hypothetical protein IFM89_029353 [Coptis chinensis]